MKNPLKHQSAPVASQHPNDQPLFQQQHPHTPISPLQTAPRRGHTHSSSFGGILQSLAFRRRPSAQSPSQEASDRSFNIVHHPDRPIVPIRQSQVPSEEDCRLILQGLCHHNGSQSTISEASVGQKPPGPLIRPKTASSPNDRTTCANPRLALAPQRTSSRTAASSTSSSSILDDDRPLPPLPLASPRQVKHHRSLPPPGPLSKRPLLPLTSREPVRSGAVGAVGAVAPSARAPSTTFEPRRFHMHGQTYDDAMAPFKAKAEADATGAQTESIARPPSRSTQLARIGPMTEAEKTRADGQPLGKDDEGGIDVSKFVSLGYQPVPKETTGHQPKPARICNASDCKGVLCRVCTPVVLRFQTPEQKAAEEQERRQLLSKSLQMRKPDLWTPKFSSPLRQSHPSSPSPRPDSGEVSPMTPPHSANTPAEAPEELLEWDIEVIKASRAKANAEIYENDEPLLGYNVEALKESNGWGEAPDEPLLEWDIEAIKALNLLPPQTKEKHGVVAIDSVVQKRPQITTSHHSDSDGDAGSECSFLAAAQYAELEEYTGDYTESWPESSYYFGSRDSMPTIDESPRHTRQPSVATTRSSASETSRRPAHHRGSSRRDPSHDNMF